MTVLMFAFDWDPRKARLNAAKHGITFDEAVTVFLDPAALLLTDPDHSSPDEERWLLLGLSERGRVLLVVHAEIDDVTIRLISARRATRNEIARYQDRS
jgi:uncharacterized DUF497 family protein